MGVSVVRGKAKTGHDKAQKGRCWMKNLPCKRQGSVRTAEVAAEPHSKGQSRGAAVENKRRECHAASNHTSFTCRIHSGRARRKASRPAFMRGFSAFHSRKSVYMDSQ